MGLDLSRVGLTWEKKNAFPVFIMTEGEKGCLRRRQVEVVSCGKAVPPRLAGGHVLFIQLKVQVNLKEAL